MNGHPSKKALAAEILALPAIGVLGVDLANEGRWDVPLLLLLLAFAIASDLTAATVSEQRIKISGSFLSIVVAIVLLGGCQAAVVAVLTILVGWFRWREDTHRLVANVIVYAAFPLLSGALFEVASETLGVRAGDPLFYLLVFGVFAVALALDFLMVAGYLASLGAASIGESARETLVPLLPSQLATALLAAAATQLYHRLGVVAIPLFGIVLLTFQYLMGELLKSKERAAALERQTDELRSSRQTLSAFVRAAPIVLWAVDLQGSFLLVEGKQQDSLGLGSASADGRSVFNLEERVPELVAGTRRALEGESSACMIEAGGLTFDAHFSPLWHDYPRVAGVIGVATDVTARVAAQRENEDLAERLSQTHRLESVGQLAGGIAHDFNNLLGVILAYTTFVLEQVQASPRIRDDVLEIRWAADRAAELTRALLLFSRRQPAASTVVDLNARIVQTTRLLARTLGERIELQTALAPGLWSIAADQGQLEQVLMNLAVNARDAMPDGGRLTFTTENRSLSEREATNLGGLAAGDYVRLSVSDTGTGISDEVQPRIFDPFFTTKEVGQGTGLGLATVYGIVGNAGGHIGVSSKPGDGTLFEVYWPVSPEARAPRTGHLEPRSLQGRGETVLVTEDEDGLRKSTERILSRNGYRVIAANGGEAALEELLLQGDPVDLLLTDVVMPDMSGPELARCMKQRLPRLRVLFMSGYGYRAMDSETGRGDAPPLAKPFATETLLARVREALSGAPAAVPADEAVANG